MSHRPATPRAGAAASGCTSPTTSTTTRPPDRGRRGRGLRAGHRQRLLQRRRLRRQAVLPRRDVRRPRCSGSWSTTRWSTKRGGLHTRPAVEVTLYWTGALERSRSPAGTATELDWTCEGGITIGIDAYAGRAGGRGASEHPRLARVVRHRSRTVAVELSVDVPTTTECTRCAAEAPIEDLRDDAAASQFRADVCVAGSGASRRDPAFELSLTVASVCVAAAAGLQFPRRRSDDDEFGAGDLGSCSRRIWAHRRAAGQRGRATPGSLRPAPRRARGERQRAQFPHRHRA